MARDGALLVVGTELDATVRAGMGALAERHVDVSFTDVAQFDVELAGPTPDLILLDVKMPTMSGYELVERIRGTTALSACVVLVLTDEQSPSGAHPASVEVLARPFRVDELVQRVSELLARQPALAQRDTDRDAAWNAWVAKTQATATRNVRAARRRLVERGLVDESGRPTTSDVPRDMLSTSKTDVAT